MYLRVGMKNSGTTMAWRLIVELCMLQAFLLSSVALAKTPRVFNWVLKETKVTRHCTTQNVVTVNGMYPGPTATVREGDTVIANVVNKCKHNATIHWHGVLQMRTGWADGPEYVTQCPIQPGAKYTYKFHITEQHGTLWWHAHASWLRTTVFGAFIILPPLKFVYPYQKPKHEEILIFSEWWDADILEFVPEAKYSGGVIVNSDTLVTNGMPGNLEHCYLHPPRSCSSLPIKYSASRRKNRAKPNDHAWMEDASYLSLPDVTLPYGSTIPITETTGTDTMKIVVKKGEKVLLRMINAGMNSPLFIGVANHTLTVVAADASYTQPYTTDYIEIDPGQTLDVVLTADQPCGVYYLVAQTWRSNPKQDFTDGDTTTTIIEYRDCPFVGTSTLPECPKLPDINDNNAAEVFHLALRGLYSSPPNVPTQLDEDMFITASINILPCRVWPTSLSATARELEEEEEEEEEPLLCKGAEGERYASSLNNISFVNPNISIMNAYYNNISGVYTDDFPDRPPRVFNYTDTSAKRSGWYTVRGTSVKKLRYNSTVQIVFQGTGIMDGESHPFHLHGHNFYVIARGAGNFDPRTAEINLRDPPKRNTFNLRMHGWTIIRFVADNPGVWLMHCHLESHQSQGMDVVFITENSPDNAVTIEPPPADLPKC